MLIGTSACERRVALLLIWALRGIMPISLLHVLLSALLPSYPLRHCHILTTSALAETLFYIFVFLPRKRLIQKPAVHPPRMSRSERRQLVLRCQSNIVDAKEFLHGWHLESTSSDKTIRRENVVEWLLWGFFSSGREVLAEPGISEEVEEYLAMYEGILGHKLPPGKNPAIKSIRLTLDEVVIYHRPLVWYLIVCLVDVITAACLWWFGFKYYTSPVPIFPPRLQAIFSNNSPAAHLSYWYRPANSPAKARRTSFPPLLFLHGIGIGLFPYAPLLIDYAKNHPDAPIIVPEILSISSRITLPPLSHEDFQIALQKIFEHHDIREYSITAHSYGTALAAGIIRATVKSSNPILNDSASSVPPSGSTDSLPQSTSTALAPKSPGSNMPLPAPSSVVLLDPIPLLLHQPSVARNFLYRPPKQANEHQLYYFACTDPGVAHSLARHFFWTHNILWKEDLAHVGASYEPKPRVGVVLSAEDIIVNSPAVWTYLTGLAPPDNKPLPARPFVPSVPHLDSFKPTLCEPSPNVLAVYLGGLDHAQMFLRAKTWRGVMDIMDKVSVIERAE